MRIRHFSKSGLTVAFTESDQAGDGNTLDVGLAITSKKDTFTRKRGHTIATGRLQRNPLLVSGNFKTVRFTEVLQTILDTTPSHETALKRAVSSAITELAEKDKVSQVATEQLG